MKKTQKSVTIAILGAISFLLLFFSFPLIPGVSFLKIDFSIIPILFGLVLFDLKSSYVILLLRSILKLLLNNHGISELVGLPMNILAIGLYVLLFALIWKKEQTTFRYLLASVLATVTLTVSMVLLNIGYAIPLYAKFAHFDISQAFGIGKYIVAMVLPFNLLEGIIFSLVFALIYSAARPVLRGVKG